jgi:hypothetical protein
MLKTCLQVYNAYMFRSFFSTILRGSSAVFSAITIPPADLRSLSLYYYAVCGPCVYHLCVFGVLVCWWSACELCSQALESTQPLTEMSTRNVFLGVNAAGAYGWQPYHFHVPIVLKCGSLNLLEPSGPLQACNGIALPLRFLLFTGKKSIVTLTNGARGGAVDSGTALQAERSRVRFRMLSFKFFIDIIVPAAL